MVTKTTYSLLVSCTSLCLLVAAPAARAITKCNGTVEVLDHSLRLVPFDNAQLTVEAKYTAIDSNPNRIVVVGATGATVHHSRDGEKRTTPFQLTYQFQPNATRVVQDSTKVTVRWCTDKAPCKIDKIEFQNVTCNEFGK